MSESLRRVTAGTSAAIRDWVAESATRNTVAKRTPTPRTESPAVVQLAERRNPESVGTRLDELRRRMLAEYQVDGKSVRVSPAFRSLHGVSDQQKGAYLAAIKKAVGPERFAKLAPHALAATSTRGTPEDIRIITQALLDAGAARELLRQRPDLPPEQAVRLVMGAYGIGLDCRGYTLRAFLHASLQPHGATGFAEHGARGAVGFDRRRECHSMGNGVDQFFDAVSGGVVESAGGGAPSGRAPRVAGRCSRASA